jgi:hypothetical protein
MRGFVNELSCSKVLCWLKTTTREHFTCLNFMHFGKVAHSCMTRVQNMKKEELLMNYIETSAPV